MALPYVLTNGEDADADQVMANFNYLDSAVVGYVAQTLEQLKATPIALATAVYNGSIFVWTAGNYTGRADDINVIKADSQPLTVGAWVRSNDAPVFATKAFAEAVGKLPPGATGWSTLGYATPGDGGAATYVVVGAEPAHPGKSFVDGVWGELTGPYNPRQFGAKGDGATDDAQAFLNMAATVPAGGVISPSPGTYIIGSSVTFPQASLQFACEPGVKIKQKSGTLTINSLLVFSGDFLNISGWPDFDGNVAGQVGVYTGRGELVRVTGNYAKVQITGRNTVASGLANVLYVPGMHGVFYVNSFDTDVNAVRCAGDYNQYFVNMYEFGQHGFVKDNAPGGLASHYTYVNVGLAITNKTGTTEAVLFDHDLVQGLSCLVDFGYLSAPNSTGADFIKFVYMKDVTLRNFRGTHATVDAFRCTLRTQEGVDRVTLDNCIFPGSYNCDSTVDCELRVMNGCIFGDAMEVPEGIGDFRGIATFEDGTAFKNCRTSAITVGTSSTGADSKLNLGRCHYNGAATYTPNVVRFIPLSTAGTRRRMTAGNVTIRTPLSTTGTFKSLAASGLWIGLSEAQDAACAQAGDRVFLCGGSDFPIPRDTEGWLLGDVLNRRTPAASTSYQVVCTTAGASTTTAWAITTVYAAGAWVYNGVNVYACVTGGTSAGAGGPTGTGAGIVDGTVVWDFVAVRAIFKTGITLGA